MIGNTVDEGVDGMFLSPPEIQHQKLKSRLGNYDREEVDELLENVASSYEQVWHERDEARTRVAQLEQELRDYQELEGLLRDSLVTGQRAAEEVKAEAAEQAKSLLEDAQRRADEIIGQAERARDAHKTEIARLRDVEQDIQSRCRSMLLGALEAIGHQAAPNAPAHLGSAREVARS